MPSNKPYIHNPKIEVRRSKLHGLGVFANANIKKGEILEECHFILDKTPFHKIKNPLQAYIFAWGNKDPDNKSKSAIVFGYGCIYNSSENNNATWETDKRKNKFIFYAVKNIKKGEEITTNYGNDYWESRNMSKKNK